MAKAAVWPIVPHIKLYTIGPFGDYAGVHAHRLLTAIEICLSLTSTNTSLLCLSI
jgi:hypothetical protein